MQLFRTKALW